MLQKSKSGFTKVGKVLPKTVKQYNLQPAIDKHSVLKIWHQAASGFLDEVCAQTKAIDFKKGVLCVACLSQEIAYQIKLLARRIIYVINQILGRDLVWSLSVEV